MEEQFLTAASIADRCQLLPPAQRVCVLPNTFLIIMGTDGSKLLDKTFCIISVRLKWWKPIRPVKYQFAIQIIFVRATGKAALLFSESSTLNTRVSFPRMEAELSGFGHNCFCRLCSTWNYLSLWRWTLTWDFQVFQLLLTEINHRWTKRVLSGNYYSCPLQVALGKLPKCCPVSLVSLIN